MTPLRLVQSPARSYTRVERSNWHPGVKGSHERARELEDRHPARRRHRARGRSGMRQGDASRRSAGAARDRMAAASDRQARTRGARSYSPERDRAGPARARWVDHGTDRACRLSPGRCHLGHAAGAQTIRSFRRGAAVALPCRHSLHPQERGHRIPARAHGGNALFRDGRRRPPRIPPQRRHHGGNAGDHTQRVEPRRARGVRDRPHRERERRSRPRTRSPSIASPAACSRRNAAR